MGKFTLWPLLSHNWTCGQCGVWRAVFREYLHLNRWNWNLWKFLCQMAGLGASLRGEVNFSDPETRAFRRKGEAI